MRIRITVPEQELSATLDDTPAARSFAALLPLKLELEDYNKTEKISDLPKGMTEEGAAAAISPEAGDIAFYAPWGNLAIFYRDFGHSPGLIKLGRIGGILDALAAPGSIEATIEVIADEGE